MTAVSTAAAIARAQHPGPVFTTEEPARYLRLSVRALQARADIPRADICAPGSDRPMWRYRQCDLDRFLQQRLINPWKADRPEGDP
jgi:hypothetical protein